MDATTIISEIASKAAAASTTLSTSTRQERDLVLTKIADGLEKNSDLILKANQIDMQNAKAAGISQSLQDRLLLTTKRIMDMAAGAREIAKLPDPLGRVLIERNLDNGLNLKQLSVPFGVVGMVYEARPNVTIDAAVILIKSGNTALLRGSATASESNKVLVDVIRTAFAGSRISQEVVQLIPSDDRSTVSALLTAKGLVDLVIPRGGAELIRSVVENATVATIETGAGVCHVYVDKSADLSKAIAILINSKCDRPSTCNAAETFLVHQDIAPNFLPKALAALKDKHVTIHGDEKIKQYCEKATISFEPVTDEDWAAEYYSLDIAAGIVDSMEEAIQHIRKWSSNQTEAIVSDSMTSIDKFVAQVDSAAVMVNASTRFTDGGEFGFGAEIGISNQKLHARGPMGLVEMTSTKYVVRGKGHIRGNIGEITK